jgi:dTDP-4-dehydrorhamnose reductase
MRLLVTGAAGMLGQDLVTAAQVAGHDVTALAHGELDVTDAVAVQRAVAGAAPDVVVNCAAWTNVDGAESSAQTAVAVNGEGAGNVAAAAEAAEAWVIQISTDYVFDGRKSAPYVESDPVGPLSQYGISKLAGEREVAARAPKRHTIARTAWLFGAGGPCFPATIMRLAGERDELTVVDDQRGCPTFTGHLARALVGVAVGDPPLGVVHLAGGGACTWYELAREVVGSVRPRCEVKPGRTADVPRPAPRPANSVLVSERGGAAPALPHWREGLSEYLAAKVATV